MILSENLHPTTKVSCTNDQLRKTAYDKPETYADNIPLSPSTYA